MTGPGSLRGGPVVDSLRDLAVRAGGRILAGAPSLPIAGVAADTRAVRPGDLFVAIRGERTDAHTLLRDAFAAGAVAALVDREPEDRWHLADVPAGVGIVHVPAVLPSLGRLAAAHLSLLSPRPCVVGVTGSVGKTGTRQLIAAALGAGGPVLVPEASFNTEITVPLVCLRATATHRFAVLELAMRGPGQIAYLAEICRPQVGVITVVGDSHLETLGSREAIAAAKGELVRALPAYGMAVLNRDDGWQAAIAARSPAPVLWYGTGPGADVTAADVRLLPEGECAFAAVVRGRRIPVRLHLIGRHQVGNALAALACADVLGVDLTAAAAALAAVEPTAGRLRPLAAGPLRVLDDTFNAAPQSAVAALSALAAMAPAGRRAAVLGDMLELGATAAEGHRHVGAAVAAAGVSWLVTVGPLAADIALGAERAGLPTERIHRLSCRAQVLSLLPGLLDATAPGTTILVKGSHALGLEEVVSSMTEWARSRGS